MWHLCINILTIVLKLIMIMSIIHMRLCAELVVVRVRCTIDWILVDVVDGSRLFTDSTSLAEPCIRIEPLPALLAPSPPAVSLISLVTLVPHAANGR